jgi:hypothetical protein
LAEPRPEKPKRQRFALSLFAALLTHVTLLTVLPRQPGQRSASLDDATPFEVDMVVEAPPPAPEAPPPPAAEAPAERRATAEAVSPSLAKATTLEKRPVQTEGEATTAPDTAGVGSVNPRAEGAGEGPRAPINFNLGPLAGRAFAPPPGAPGPEGPPPPPPDPADRVRKSLQQAQDTHDRELGLGWGGEVVAAANSGPIRDAAPGGEGNAVIEVELDATGGVVSARVRSSSSQADGWRRVADALLAALRGRRVRGLDGSRGGRIALRLQTRERLPSGADAVVKQCGLGACGDLADIGTTKIRTMNVSLERKERL